MARTLKLLALALFALPLTGCVAQEKYNALKLDRDAQAERLVQSENAAQAATAENALLKSQLAALGGNDGSKNAMILSLKDENSTLQRQLDEINRRYQDAVNMVGKGAPLPEALNTALQQFAQANPDLVDFDSARGMVKFKSDVTFAVGSADLTDKARTAIGRFAQILNSGSAGSYELMVAGHTDNAPVNNPETKRKGHLDNWYLSSHRAISVGQALQAQGVAQSRLAVVGYADQRPIAANTSEAGKAQNRRVEVLILPSQARAGSTAAPVNGGVKPAPKPVLNKDTPTGSEQKPQFNK